MTASEYAGTGALVRASFRRDRVLVSIWGAALVAMTYASAAATGSLYPTVDDQVSAAEAINASPAVVALYGPILDVHSLGELAMTKMTVLYAVFVSALFVVMVRRHTRVEEESGRTELLGGTGVGRDAPLAAAALEALLVAAGVGVLAAAANAAGGLPVVGSLAFGASWLGIGAVGIGIGSVASQLSASARTCGAAAASALGAAYLLRAVGDTTTTWVSWSSPFGWGTRLRAYSDVRWWVLGLYAAAAIVLVVSAQALRARRDLGSGLFAARPGPAAGRRWLQGPVSLAFRVQAASVAVWTVATATMGVVLGAIVPNVSDLLDSPTARAMMARLGGEGGVERALIGAELSIVAVAVACFGISVFSHAASEEAGDRTELVLSAAVSRLRVFLATSMLAFAGVLWLLGVAGAAIAVGYGSAGAGIGHSFGEVMPAALVQAPAAAVVVAIAAVLFSLRASWNVAGWVIVAAFVTVGQVGELLDLPRWVLNLSPYTHTPTMPVGSFEPAPVAVLSAAAGALLGLAWWRYRARSIG